MFIFFYTTFLWSFKITYWVLRRLGTGSCKGKLFGHFHFVVKNQLKILVMPQEPPPPSQSWSRLIGTTPSLRTSQTKCPLNQAAASSYSPSPIAFARIYIHQICPAIQLNTVPTNVTADTLLNTYKSQPWYTTERGIDQFQPGETTEYLPI
jgi:hypothetical protein